MYVFQPFQCKRPCLFHQMFQRQERNKNKNRKYTSCFQRSTWRIKRSRTEIRKLDRCKVWMDARYSWRGCQGGQCGWQLGCDGVRRSTILTPANHSKYAMDTIRKLHQPLKQHQTCIFQNLDLKSRILWPSNQQLKRGSPEPRNRFVLLMVLIIVLINFIFL